MFKLYHTINNVRHEVIPLNNIYTVKELGFYEFYYENLDVHISNTTIIFIEDIPLDTKYFIVDSQRIRSVQPHRLFMDYFGFASLIINGEQFKLNIQIEKLKLSEIEEILLYLWNIDNKLFDNFFSKSTVTAKTTQQGNQFGLTSKYLLFADFFWSKFSSLYLKFKNNPHSVLRKEINITDYSPQKVTSHTVDWILNNLENICFDESLNGHPDTIAIADKVGFIDKIETIQNEANYSVYENQIILGAFQNLINKLRGLKKEIYRTVDPTEIYSSLEYADFRDLKKLPFVKLLKETDSIENKLQVLYKKYQIIFKQANPKLERPRITNVFSHNYHYRAAYYIIRDLYDYKIDFEGELSLFNIKRLSELYEIYNLHQIFNCFQNKLKIELFRLTTSSTRENGLLDFISFDSEDVLIKVFHQLSYPNDKIELERIDKSKSSYYTPDYIIEFSVKSNVYYVVLDAKYTKYETLLNNYLSPCINKYILNTGLRNERYKKVEDLLFLYPGEIEGVIIDNPDFSPQVRLLPSKPRFEQNLEQYLGQVLERYLPSSLLV